ncbi:hypothetical protein Tco_0252029 [Tanacetum coccineum]
MNNVNTFTPMETEDRERASELVVGSSQATITDFAEVGSSKRATEAELNHEGSKRQKTNEASGSVQEQPDEEEKELSQEDLQQMMMVVPVEEVYVEALQVKYPIIGWEVYTEESRKYWKITRVGNHTEPYQFFECDKNMMKVKGFVWCMHKAMARVSHGVIVWNACGYEYGWPVGLVFGLAGAALGLTELAQKLPN